ncbi:Ig-like domain-containing protein [Myxococcus sp. K38C18041901]|uniref:Ig-like domain-containing protein n=1 Tax=Myxococcus guangdongensis TaxID=2906760 RepID=UPI0020A7C234|nr:Ig-like domain-containing protein [Myxococcus guangdongensis]MCP3057295.1 Ig-like domain-containing protein [Myxococcus guangdongensis]
MTNRLRLSVPLFAVFLLSACIDVPDVAEPEDIPDAGQPPSDAGSLPDGGEQPAGDFELSVMPTEDSILQGATRSFQVSLVRKNGFNGSVSVMLVSPPGGITAPSVTIPGSSTLSALTISVSEQVTPGPMTLTVRGISGALHRDRNISLTIVPLGDLAVSWVAPSASHSATNGGLSVEVAVQGGQAEKVELMKGDTVLTTWTAAPYTYSWDTTTEAEGEYTLVAKATRAGSTFPSVARTVVVDRTAPSIVSRQPGHGATQVSARTTVEVVFSEAVKAATVSTSNVGLTGDGGASVPVTLNLSADGRTLTLTPVAPLAASTSVSVRLGTAEQPITDAAGNVLTTGGVWSFAVPFWLPMGGAISAYPGNTPAENMVMKVGTDGVPVIAWSESDGTNKHIHVRQWSGQDWRPLGGPLRVHAMSGAHAERPDLAIDNSGRIIIAWDEALGKAGVPPIQVMTWSGTLWQSLTPPPFPNDSDTETTIPKLAVDASGTIIIYAQIYHTTAFYESKAYTLAANQQAWTQIELFYGPDWLNNNLNAITNTSDTTFTAHSSYVDSLGTRAITITKNHAFPFGAPLISSPTDAYAAQAALATNGAGEPLTAWNEIKGFGASSNVFFSRWLGSAWQSPELVTPHSTNNSSPSLAMGADGSPLLAWSGFVEPEQMILVARRSTTSWTQVGPALSAESGASTPATRPVLALGKENRPIVAWLETTSTGAHVYVVQQNQ